MPKIRLLQSVAGDRDDPVDGDAGAVLEVDKRTAKAWADGVRAELVDEPPTRDGRPRAPETTSTGPPELRG